MTECPIELLRALIACKSITPHQAGALDIVGAKLSAAGFVVERMPKDGVDNLWAYYNDGKGEGGDANKGVGGGNSLQHPKEIKLLFAGHIDVVPPGDLNQWQSDPFVATERDGYIYGRGAADMKSGVAAMTVAALNAAAEGYANGLALLLTSDEEGEAINGTAHVVRVLQSRGTKIQRCIIGEPTSEETFGDTIKVGRRGSLTGYINVQGIQCHAAYPHHGDNPIPRLITALNQCQQQFATFTDGDKNFTPTTFQIVKINSGIADNVIPGTATATINFRHTPNTKAQTLIDAVETILKTHTKENHKIQWRKSPPFTTNKNAPLIQTLKTIIKKETNTTPKTSTTGGTSDGRFLKDICNELAEFGPNNKTIHHPNEKTKITDLTTLTKIHQKTTHHLLTNPKP